MSLEVRINGNTADLNPDSRVDLELTNPFLTYETLFTKKATLPGIPMSGLNKRLLGFSESLQVTGADRFEVQHLYNGQIIQEGVGVLADLDGRGYQLAVDEPLGEFFGIYQRLYLSEIAFGTVPIPSGFTPVLQAERPDGSFEDVICFPTIVNPDYYGSNGASIGYQGRMNNPNGNGPRCPAVFVKWLLHQIEIKTGVTIGGALLAHPQLSKLILINPRALDEAEEVVVRNHLPNWTIGELLLQLRKLLNLSFNFVPAKRKLSIGLTDDIFRQPAQEDWSKKAVKGYTKRQEPNHRLHLSFELDSKDQLLKDRPAAVADYVTPGVQAGLAKVTTKLCPTLVDEASGLPTIRLAGQTTQFAQGATEWVPRIAFWNGVVGGVGLALPSLDGVRLDWNGPGGLQQTLWRYTEAFRMRMFYAERGIILTEADLARLDFTQKKHINGVNYVVARVVVSLPVMKAAQCLLVRA